MWVHFLYSIQKIKKVKPWCQDRLIAAGPYPGFYNMKRLEVFLLPLDAMLVHCRSLPLNLSGFPNNLPVPIYTPGWRVALGELSVLLKNTTKCPRPGLEPGMLAPESSTLTMGPPHLPHSKQGNILFCSIYLILLFWTPYNALQTDHILNSLNMSHSIH